MDRTITKVRKVSLVKKSVKKSLTKSLTTIFS